MSRLIHLPIVFAFSIVMVAQPTRASAQPAPIKPDDELVKKVEESIRKGVNYLKKQQTPQGHWEGTVLKYLADMDGGATALVTLALLNSGVPPEDPAVARALDYLRTLPPRKTYVVGLQNMVFAEARQAKDRPRIQENVEWLEQRAIGYNRGAGRLEGWSYPGGHLGDNSNTQYALLGLYAAKQAGVKVSDDTWKAIQEYYTRTQGKATDTTGFWTYQNASFDKVASFTMTVAGVCGLLIAGMGLDQSAQQLDPATGVAKACGVYSENDAVARGMNWITANFSFEQGKSIFYNVYGIERLGRLSGQRFIGRRDWYREGCVYLIDSCQDRQTGAFSRKGGNIDGADVLSTAFSVLFLSKGRTPVLISKFAWGDYQDRGGGTFVERGGPREGVVNWNRKHNDARHLVEFASRELFKGATLGWQVYDTRRQSLETDAQILAEVGVLLQSPVVYLNGHGRLPFVGLPGEVLTTQEKVLQKYVDEGGFIFAEACCGDPEFTASFRALMKRLFPLNDLRPLPDTHAIWTAFYKEPGLAAFAGVEGLEKGCRTVVFFSPRPMAGYWEEERFMPGKGKPPALPTDPVARGEAAYKLAANVIAYATGLELPKPKLTTTKVYDPNAAESGPTRGLFQVAQLKFAGDAEPAPAAVRNLMGYLRDQYRLEVRTDKASPSPGPGDDNLFKYKFMYFHGRKPIDLSDYDAGHLRANLQTGAILFVDAGCNGFESWKAFDASFRATCKKLFPESPLQVISPSDELFSGKMNGGQALTNVICRRERPDGSGPETEKRSYTPYLEGVKVDGRWVIVYSKYDVGCALEGNKAADCMGHDKESALRLASAVVLYSLKR